MINGRPLNEQFLKSDQIKLHATLEPLDGTPLRLAHRYNSRVPWAISVQHGNSHGPVCISMFHGAKLIIFYHEAEIGHWPFTLSSELDLDL